MSEETKSPRLVWTLSCQKRAHTDSVFETLTDAIARAFIYTKGERFTATIERTDSAFAIDLKGRTADAEPVEVHYRIEAFLLHPLGESFDPFTGISPN